MQDRLLLSELFFVVPRVAVERFSTAPNQSLWTAAPLLVTAALSVLALWLHSICRHFFPLHRHGNIWEAHIMQGKEGLIRGFMVVIQLVCLRYLDPFIGCQSVASHAATISRISASLVPEGYVRNASSGHPSTPVYLRRRSAYAFSPWYA